VQIGFRHWAVLGVLVTLWGSSYLAVEFALAMFRPAQIVALRVLTGAVVLLIASLAGRHALPRDLRHWGWFLAIAVVGNCLPFFLISWGQQQVESGLAGILAASTPLVVMLLAHFLLDDERLSRWQVLAFLLGFAGIVVLMGPDSLAALGGSEDRLLSQLAVFGGAVCYAVATVSARFMPAAHPVVTSTGVMLLATALMGRWGFSGAALLPGADTKVIGAIGFLGLMGTGVASILYFYLIQETGARFTSLLNYLVPVWAVALGAWVLGERLPITSWLALGMILGALVLMRDSAAGPRSASVAAKD
jgi:drug/metabolite transporter (DMT)-like permease